MLIQIVHKNVSTEEPYELSNGKKVNLPTEGAAYTPLI